MALSVSETDYPALFQTSDLEAIKAKKGYLCRVQLEFLFIILAAVTSSLSGLISGFEIILAISIPVFLVLALIARLLAEGFGLSTKWFSCRAIAEAVKEATLRYMMRATPYQGAVKSKAIDDQFLEILRKIRDNRLSAAKELGDQSVTGDDISANMRQMRVSSLKKRKVYYDAERVRDQKGWYNKKVKLNEKNKKRWFWISLLVEMFAVILAIVLALKQYSFLTLMGVLTTIAAVIIAWSQVNKFRELAQSYSLVLQNLRRISSTYIHVRTNNAFSDYVDQIEGVVSKEHEMWLARRGQ